MTPIGLYLATVLSTGLAADLHGAFNLSDSTSVNVRPLIVECPLPGKPQGSTEPPLVDLDNRPAATLALSLAGLSAYVGYAPQFSLRSVFNEEDRTTTTLHTAFLGVTGGTKRFTASLGVSASLGTQSFTKLVIGPIDPNTRPDPAAARIDFVPPSQTVEVLSETVGANVSYAWDSRWSTGASLSYTISGGRGEAAQLVLPQQKNVGGDLSVDFVATTVDQLGAALGASHTSTSNGNEYTALHGSSSWGHRFTADTGMQLGVGVSGVRAHTGTLCTQNSVCTDVTSLYPTASVSGGTSLVRERDFTLAFGGGLSIAPMITAVTGDLQQRLQGTASLNAGIFQNTTASASFDSAQTIPADENQARIIGVGVSASHRLGKLVDVSAGYRTAWQYAQDPVVGNIPRLWTAYLGLSFRTPPLTF